MPAKGKADGDDGHGDPTDGSPRRAWQLAKGLRSLNKDNFHEWRLDLIAVQYSARWDLAIIDIDGALGTAHKWDGSEEKDLKICNGRRDAYDVMRMRVDKELQYLVQAITPGDAHGIYAQLSKRYSQMTTGAISALTTLTNNITMIGTGLSVEPYAYNVQTKHARLMFVTGRKDSTITYKEAIGIF